MPTTDTPDIEVRQFAERDRKAVISLWHRCELTRPWKDPETDIDLATACTSSIILVGEHEGAIIASAMVGFDGHRGWVYYLAVDPVSHGKGHGRRMMCAAEAWLALFSAPKVKLMIRDDNRQALGFYEALGYQPAGFGHGQTPRWAGVDQSTECCHSPGLVCRGSRGRVTADNRRVRSV